MRIWLAVAALTLTLTTAARAEVVDATPGGFQVRQSVEIAAPAARVWASLVQPALWWDPRHTWSGSAANLSLAAASGGCFCERLPGGGSVMHMSTVHAAPNARLTLFGALGPLQNTGAAGHLNILLSEKDGRTTVTLTYDVGGYMKGGLATLAAPVDGVLGQQIQRLKGQVETGKAG
ncbi:MULTISPECIES: SRPBCC family protein [unclassified Caulobacter]|uniref:SRPBCC family protein n=1 Tax=unclassified Caulobacter TaxID=2648921 RepID=UPI000D33F7AB|nr:MULTISPECIES: SRPBCC family protein [unclassified Caulobacter]PTS81779.1 ATPase [Caulobacter sp. HMWF009]PTT06872.1 ATPase [Caulobacter sp. HMWF025]